MLSAPTHALTRATSELDQDAQVLDHLDFEFPQWWSSTGSLGPVSVLHHLPGEFIFLYEEEFFLLQLVSFASCPDIVHL